MDNWQNTQYENRDYDVGGKPGGYSSEGEDWKVVGGAFGIVLLILASAGLIIGGLFF